jgi:tRNA-2-methylthio-N6-dimethylallyladenosine synthase
MKSFHIITFGCQMNEHDSERMAGLLEARGCVPAAAAEDADIVILNTCSIREKAEQKFFSELGRLVHAGAERGKTPRIAVAGCVAQQEGERILARVPGVDLVVGPSDLPKIAGLADEAPVHAAPAVEVAGDPDYHRRRIPAARNGRLKAWVSIMYGCDNFCTYCVVPHLRGRERSRPAEDIVQEVRELAARGFREITLLGQNVNSYGKGIEPRLSFPGLLARVHAVPGIERIRFVTSHPRDLSDELIAAMRDLPKVCEALHLPVQSGSDRVLAAMNRRYTVDEYRDRVERLRASVPDVALTTDIIVGFPGETDDDFKGTLRLLEDMQYDNIFAFKYSPRPRTAALGLGGQVPEAVKDERLGRVFGIQRAVNARRGRELEGRVVEVLVEGASARGGTLTGRTRGNRVVNFAGPDGLAGSLVRVRISKAGPNSLFGETCE